MKKTFVYGILAISLMIATPMASVFATTVSSSNTANGYTDNVQVSGTYSGGSVTGYSFLSTGSCTPGTYHCTSSGYYLSIFILSYYTISGVNYYYMNAPNGGVLSTTSSSVYTLQASWNPGTGAASEVYNEGTAGYTNSGSYTAVTALIDAGIPLS